MADSYDRHDNESSAAGFMMGLLTGTVLGAGLGMLLAPKAGSELRGSIGEQARHLGTVANDQYRRASESATGWADKGREFVDKARDAVSRGADEARGYAGATTGSSYGGSGTTGDSTGSTPGAFGANTGSVSGGDFNRS
jgi:gas vesicle protein